MKSSREHERAAVTVLAVSASGVSSEDGLRDLWTRLEPAVTRRGGTVTRCAGNTLEAVFPPPDDLSVSGDAVSAVEAALEMLRESHAADAGHPLGAEISLRIGAHRGPLPDTAVTLPDNAAESGILHAALTLRSRALPGQVLVTEAVFRQAQGLVDVQVLDADGTLGQGIFRVWGMRPRPVHLTPYIGATLLVGREAEMAFLHSAFQQAIETGKSRFITVTGPAGMGKSRLVNEFLRRLDAQNQPFILFRGRADPTAASRPHALLRDLLAFRFKILESDSPELARAKLVGGVQDWLGPEGVEVAHWMGQFAGFDFSGSPYLRDHLEDTARARLTALAMMRKFLAAVAAQTPVLIVLDNVQWADDGSLDGLEALTRMKPAGPVFIIALARPELIDRRPRWAEYDHNQNVIALSPLQHQETAAMASQTLRSALGSRNDDSSSAEGHSGRAQRSSADIITLPARLIDRIVEASGGNPYFVEELVKNYMETGILVWEGEVGETAWRIDMTRLASAQPPPSLDEALRSHLDVLTPFERAVIHRAAVVGQVFWDGAVRALLDHLEPEENDRPNDASEADSSTADVTIADLSAALQSLREHGLILRRENSAMRDASEYLFRSPQLHAVVYANTPLSLRARGHALVGDWLAEHHAGQQDVYAATIAGHYDLGSAPVRAAAWYARAGVMARNVAAPEAAARFFLHALETLPEGEKYLPRRVELYNNLWDVQWWQAQYGAALATARDLLAVAEMYNNIPAQAAAWNRMAAVYNRMGEPRLALQSVQRAERLARQGSATGELVKALFNRGVTLDQLGHTSEALEAGQQALAFNQSMLDQGVDIEAIHEAARILNLMGAIHQRAGRYERAGENFRRLLEIARAREDSPAILSALMGLGENLLLQGEFLLAAGVYQDALEMARAGRFHDQELICMDALAGTHAEMGEYPRAEEELREVKRRASGRHWLLLPEFYCHRAIARMGSGRLPEALSDAMRALEQSRETDTGQGVGATAAEQVGRAWRVLGRVLAHSQPPATVNVDGKDCDVYTCYAASMQVFVELGMPGEQARTLRDWANYELAQGDRREGLRMWKEARDTFAALGMKAEVERMERPA